MPSAVELLNMPVGMAGIVLDQYKREEAILLLWVALPKRP